MTKQVLQLKEKDFIVSSDHNNWIVRVIIHCKRGSCISTDEIVGLGNLGGYSRQSSYAGGAKRSFNWRRQPPATTEKETK